MRTTDTADIDAAFAPPPPELIAEAERAAAVKRDEMVAELRANIASARERDTDARRSAYEAAWVEEGRTYEAWEALKMRTPSKTRPDADADAVRDARRAWDKACQTVNRLGEAMRADMGLLATGEAEVAALMDEGSSRWSTLVSTERGRLERAAQVKAAAATRKAVAAEQRAAAKAKVERKLAKVDGVVRRAS